MITIYTQDYRHALEDLFAVSYDPSRKLTQARCPLNALDLEALARLLERIVILRHPIYGHSPKLIEMALELKPQAIQQANVKELEQYFSENTTLYLEGYAAFRMSDFSNKLDMMMYRIIKKMKLTDSW